MAAIKPSRITASGFAPFGKIVTAPQAAPTSQAYDYKFWSDIADYEVQGETEIGLCKVYVQQKQEISGVERHMRTPEILIPVDAPFILPLFDDASGKAQAFQVNLGEAVVINTAVWHGACLPVGKKEATYFVIFRKGTPHEDVVKKSIDPVQIQMPE
jgi:ureidoglycolate hydrolase